MSVVLSPCIVVQYFVSFLVLHHPAGVERAGWSGFYCNLDVRLLVLLFA